MKFKKEEDFIFPAPPFFESSIQYVKDNLIQIPTGRMSENNVEIKIPCLFKKNQNSKNLLISFHCNGMDAFSTFLDISRVADELGMNCLAPEYQVILYILLQNHRNNVYRIHYLFMTLF